MAPPRPTRRAGPPAGALLPVLGVILAVALAPRVAGGGAPAPPAVGAVHALVKVRPAAAAPRARSIALDAARNEVEPFQIVVRAGGAPLAISAAAGPLRGQAGVIPAASVRLYAERLYQARFRSNVEGGRGAWPDALVPEVDAYAGERRRAFPLEVPAGEARAIWVDVFVPPDARPGGYAGEVTVSADGRPLAAIAIRLRVRSFALPSTATLRSAFGFSADLACRAHLGTRFCEGDAEAAPFVDRYTRAALAHRITLMSPYYRMPEDRAGWARFDQVAGAFLSGADAGPLRGARLTTLRSGYRRDGDPAWTRNRARDARAHLAARRWTATLFDYTADEPHACVREVPARAAVAHAAGLRTLVTTDLERLRACGWEGQVDILCPAVNQVEPPGRDAAAERARYDAFLSTPGKELWWYQSCMSHGCRPEDACDAAQEGSLAAGWPSYAIDAAPLQARAMEWLSFRRGVTGELYFETVMNLDRAWRPDGLCAFGGQGDGALFYPGDPASIGGRTPIPIESIRLKLIREGMEDYEYLRLLSDLGGGALARAEADRLFPAASRVTDATPEALYAARRRIADAIEQRLAAGARAGGAEAADAR
jgi:hypothetical protein